MNKRPGEFEAPSFYVPLPRWIKRRIVMQNPWLLADGGAVNRNLTLRIWPLLVLNFHANIQLSKEEREMFQNEIDRRNEQ